MSSIKTAFTDSSTVNPDLGYLILTADLDGYLKVRTPNSDLINITKPLSYFTASDAGNYLRWINPNSPGFEIINGTFSLAGDFDINLAGDYYEDQNNSLLYINGLLGVAGGTHSGNYVLDFNEGFEYAFDIFESPKGIQLYMGVLDLSGSLLSNAIIINKSQISHLSFTNSTGYTHSIFKNGNDDIVLKLMSDGDFTQKNYSTGLQLNNGTFSLLGFDVSFCGSYYEDDNVLYQSGISHINSIGKTYSGISAIDKITLDSFGYSVSTDSGTIGYYNFLTQTGNQIQISSDYTQYSGYTSSSGYTHSRFVNSDYDDVMVLYNDGGFAQTNLTTGVSLFNGTFSLGSTDALAGAVWKNGSEFFASGLDVHNGITSSIVAYADFISLYTHYIKANSVNMSVKYTDLTTFYTQGFEVDYTGTKIVGLTANNDVNLRITDSVNSKFEFYNDGNLKMKNNVGDVYFNGVDQDVTVINPLVSSNSHVIISMSYSGVTTPSIGWVQKGSGTFSVHDKNGFPLSYSYLIINPL